MNYASPAKSEMTFLSGSANHPRMPIREDDESPDAFGERLRAVMEMRGLRPTDMVVEGTREAPKLTNWRAGRNIPSTPDLLQLCKDLNVTTDFMLRGRIGGMDWETVERLRSTSAPPMRAQRPRKAKPPPSKTAIGN